MGEADERPQEGRPSRCWGERLRGWERQSGDKRDFRVRHREVVSPGEGSGSSSSNLPPHKFESRNHESTTTHTTDVGSFGNFFFFSPFLKDQYSFFFICPHNENRFLNASNIQISPMHTHSREAEVRAATRWGAGGGVASRLQSGAWQVAGR